MASVPNTGKIDADDSTYSYAAMQAQPAELAYRHSSIVYTDSYGNMGLRCSRSSPSSIDDFLRPVAMSGELCWSHCHGEPHPTAESA
jgi:hypothetical protein